MSAVYSALVSGLRMRDCPDREKTRVKGVPIYAGVGFLLTGPLINPIVVLSTYMALAMTCEWPFKGCRRFAAAVIIALRSA
ncbi:hypothetical protein PO124_03780 [Bacillus licheniformis]|nr:hypothetical protein [Bacillus licheniformis]